MLRGSAQDAQPGADGKKATRGLKKRLAEQAKGPKNAAQQHEFSAVKMLFRNMKLANVALRKNFSI
ncbi:hypothetical protein ACFIQF_00570 [Comamonas sp. J-3]|uniref:hypothetical protein n=1 Tax=Comamonas trifloxystrobinivorans TaxID=3350256 RepID=UPI0037283C8B